jgi:hypothetical protein
MRWNGKSCGWCWETSDTRGMPTRPLFPPGEGASVRRQPGVAIHLKRILGILLLIAFSLQLEWLPLIGGGDFSDPLSTLHHLTLCAATGSVWGWRR